MSVSDAQNPDTSDQTGRTAEAESADHDFAQDAARWFKDLGSFPPLMKNPTAAMAAATAVGFGMTSHFAGFMLGAMQGMVEAATKAAGAAEEAAKQAVAEAERAKAAADALAEQAERAGASQAARAAEAVHPEVQPAAPVAAVACVAEPGVAKLSQPAVSPVQPAADAMMAVAPAVAKAPKGEGASEKPARSRKAKVDDLKRIEGVGPKLEQVLRGLGVTRFADIAAWTEEDIRRFDAALGIPGRIARDRWVEQAKALSRG